MNTDTLLKQTEFFSELSDSARKEISAHIFVKNFSQNDILFLEGEEGSVFYILVKGSIKLYKTGPDGKEITIRLVKSNEMFAETILYENDKYPVNADAVIDSKVLAIQRISFHQQP